MYVQYCQSFRAPPCQEALALFRHTSVTRFVAPADFTLRDLLPLAEVLAFDNVLTHLDFSGVTKPMGDLAAHALAAMLNQNRTIESLNLSYQNLGPEGITMICKALEKSKSLVSLRLRGNNAGPEGASPIARLIKRNLCRLRYVDVSNNGLAISGVHTITAALKARAAEILRLQASSSAAAGAVVGASDGSGYHHHHHQNQNNREQDHSVGISNGSSAGFLMGRARSGSTAAAATGAMMMTNGGDADGGGGGGAGSSALRQRRASSSRDPSRPSSRRGSRSSSLSNEEGIDLATAAVRAAAASTDVVPSSVGWLWGGLSDLKLSTDLVVRASWEDRPGVATSAAAGTTSTSSSSSSSRGELQQGVLATVAVGTALAADPAALPLPGASPVSLSSSASPSERDETKLTGEALPSVAEAAEAEGGESCQKHDGSDENKDAGAHDQGGATGASSSSSEASGLLDAAPPSSHKRKDFSHARRASTKAAALMMMTSSIPELQIKISGNFVREEVASAALHGVGFLTALFGSLPVLLRKAHLAEDPALTFGLLLYSGGLLAFFGSSTLRHSLFLTDAAAVFRLIDHATVFLLIGATYSPFLLTNLHQIAPFYAWTLFWSVWTLVLFGAAVCSVRLPLPRIFWRAIIRANKLLARVGFSATGRTAASAASAGSSMEDAAAALLEDTLDPPLYRSLRLWIYFLAGWLGLLPFITHYRALPGMAWFLLGFGGVLFSLGLTLTKGSRHDPNRLPTAYSSLVLLASSLHWLSVYQFAGRPPTMAIADA